MRCGYRAWNRQGGVGSQTELSGELIAGGDIEKAPGGGAFALGLQVWGEFPGKMVGVGQALLAEGALAGTPGDDATTWRLSQSPLCPQMSVASWPRSPSPWPPRTSPPTTSVLSSSTTHW